LVLDAVPFRESIHYPFDEFIAGTEFADLKNISIFRIAQGMEPASVFKLPLIIFLDFPVTVFTVVGIEEDSPTSSILTLRPQEWSKLREDRKAGDPYKRYSKRGSWGVDVEGPNGTKRFYAALDVRAQDSAGDLRIEVENEPVEQDAVWEYVRNLEIGDSVNIRGPRRPKESPTKKGLLKF
jgi:hypothetical protein